MLIQFFKNNNPASYIILPLLTIVLWFPGFFIEQEVNINQGMPLFDMLVLPLINLPLVPTLIAMILVIAEAFILNIIINENDLLPTHSFLPSLLFILLMSCNKDLMTLHPILFANLFILFTINKLISSYRKNVAFSQAFDAGLLFSIASLFYLPYLLLLPVLGIGLQIFRPLIWREWVICFMGILFPYLFVFVFYYWNDALDYLWYNKIFYSIIVDQTSPVYNLSYYLMISTGLIIAGLSIFKLYSDFSGNSQKTKKGILLLVWLLVFTLISLLVSGKSLDEYFRFIAIPIALFASNLFLQLKKQWLGELILIVYLGSILVNHFIN